MSAKEDSIATSEDAVFEAPALLLKLAFTPIAAVPGTLTLNPHSIEFVNGKTDETVFSLPISSVIGFENKWAPVAHFLLRTTARNYKFYFQAGTTMDEGVASYQIGEKLKQVLTQVSR